MRFIMIQENNNSAFVSCSSMFLETSICMDILTITSRLLIVPSQLMPYLRLAIMIIYHPWSFFNRVRLNSNIFHLSVIYSYCVITSGKRT